MGERTSGGSRSVCRVAVWQGLGLGEVSIVEPSEVVNCRVFQREDCEPDEVTTVEDEKFGT